MQRKKPLEAKEMVKTMNNNQSIELFEAVEFLKSHDDFLIISHKNPDGDTIGCAFSLYYGLTQLGKRAKIACSDEFPWKYSYIFNDYKNSVEDFPEKTIVSVDLADKQLFGSLEEYADRVDLCIDHHPSNTFYAKRTLVRSEAAAACEIMFEVLSGLGVKFTKNISNALYTGLITDSGCFKYTNTTANTHLVAAELIKLGCDYGQINKKMFDTKTRARLAMEKEAIESLEYFFDNKCAVMTVTDEMLKRTAASDGDMEGLAALPREIEGVEVGITLRQKGNGFKVSFRTGESVNASEICQSLGGGGHARAAGCFIEGSAQNAKEILLKKIEEVI